MLDQELDRFAGATASTLGLILFRALGSYSDEQLLEWLKDDDPIIRNAVAVQLHLRSSPQTFDAIAELAKSRRYEYREAAAIAMGQFGTPEYPFIDRSFDILTDMLADAYFEVQAAALYAFGHLAGGKQPPAATNAAVLAMAGHQRQEVRAALGFSLLSFDAPGVRATLERLADDEAKQVRENAQWCLQARK